MKNTLYIFSGLGADKRVFEKMDLSAFSPVFVDWISPLQNESLEHYAKRLSEKILVQREQQVILLGISFGGMIAVELAKHIQPKRVILLNSAKTKMEIPWYFRLLGKGRMVDSIPERFLKNSNQITQWFFGVDSKYEKQMLQQILQDTDPSFLKWAIKSILQWQNQSISSPVFHIHGTKDRILPIKFVNFDAQITDGGHLMTLDKHQEILRHLQKQIKNSL